MAAPGVGIKSQLEIIWRQGSALFYRPGGAVYLGTMRFDVTRAFERRWLASSFKAKPALTDAMPKTALVGSSKNFRWVMGKPSELNGLGLGFTAKWSFTSWLTTKTSRGDLFQNSQNSDY